MKKFILILLIASLLICIQLAFAKDSLMTRKKETEKSILCDDKNPKAVRVTIGRVSVLNFPFKPKDIVKISPYFYFKQIKNDLIITAHKIGARSNVVVYLEECRCLFNLVSVQGIGDDMLIVKDAKDSQYEVRF